MTHTRSSHNGAGRRGRVALACALPAAVLTALIAPASVQAADAHPAATTASERGHGAKLPSDVLNLRDWKVTLPIGKDEHPTEIFQPELDGYAKKPYFTVTDSGRAVRFRAPVNGVTTSGSSNPRTELREMERGGGDETEWSSTSGKHTLTVREAFTHLPKDKPHVVGAQIHGGDDDVTALRLEGTKLYITKGDTTHHHLITDKYKLGTVFKLTYVVSKGKVKIYYNGKLETTLKHSDSSNYFKTGAYTQANCKNSKPCSASNYGEVEIRDVRVRHQR
ncbi:polysaccharide lyase family 7 protein [Streptomyces sp. 796.1]|uniref:polysaccharide lyase family 7 protein n=1 Tax=Streptomyces sp. 796.1 TaxID=3163029 RepID=UPI0039C9E169